MNKNIKNIPNFVSHAQILVPIIHHCLSGNSDQKIVISKSLFLQKPFIIPIEHADAECIAVEDFLANLDVRINQEHAYYEEISQLKNNLCDEFNKLCEGVTDKDFIKFVRDQRQRIINAVIDETKIEQKMIATKLFNDMMNGFEEEVLKFDQFNQTVHMILWKPLLKPYPIDALNKLKEFRTRLSNERFHDKIEEIASELVNDIKNHMRIKDIKDCDFKTSEELRSTLEKISNTRQICNVEVIDVIKNESILEEFIGKCVENVKIVISSKIFLQYQIKINYEELYLIDKIEGKNIKNLFSKIQKNVNVLKMGFDGLKNENSKNYEEIEKNLSKFKELKNLDIDFRNNNFGLEGITILSSGLKNLSSMTTLILDLTWNNLRDEGTIILSNILKELNNLSTLSLILYRNKIKDKGVAELSAGLKNLKIISFLSLDFQYNSIGSEGAIALSAALAKLTNISDLNLNLLSNNFGDEGVLALATCLEKLTNIVTLNLNLGINNIEERGIIGLSTSLKHLLNAKALNLNLTRNNIGEDGENSLQDLRFSCPTFKIKS